VNVFFPLGYYLSQFIFGPVLFLLSMFIIVIILLQRGKGGGLTGALGGLGGQSAFGVKAGDVFTRITAVAVLLWIFTCALACFWFRPARLDIEADLSGSTSIGTSGDGFGAGFEGIPSLTNTPEGTESATPTPPDAASNPTDDKPLPDATAPATTDPEKNP
jgi:preprotein translocase subunit SecG